MTFIPNGSLESFHDRKIHFFKAIEFLIRELYIFDVFENLNSKHNKRALPNLKIQAL